MIPGTCFVNDVAISYDGTLLASASLDGTARLWQIDGTPLAELTGPAGQVYRARFATDDRRLVTSHADGSVRWWIVDDDELLETARNRITRPLTEDERSFYPDLIGPLPGRNR